MIANDILETDIVFECPSCTKSMAIDPRGAGRVINCSGCGKRLVVPSPTPSAPAAPTAAAAGSGAATHAVDGSAAPEEQVRVLTERLQEVSARAKYLEHVRTKNHDRFDRVRQEFSVIQGALDRLYETMQELDADRDAEG